MAETADAPVSGTGGLRPCRFDPRRPDQFNLGLITSQNATAPKPGHGRPPLDDDMGEIESMARAEVSEMLDGWYMENAQLYGYNYKKIRR